MRLRTPIMFAYELFERAARANAHIVLPEGSDDRILRAASTLLARGTVRLTILGVEAEVRARGVELGLTLDGAAVITTLLNAAHALGLGSCWVHRAKEEFESEEGKTLLKKWGISGDYEGIGHVVLGYAAGDAPEPAPRKADYIVRV